MHLNRRCRHGPLQLIDLAALTRDLFHLLLQFLGQPHDYALNVVGLEVRLVGGDRLPPRRSVSTDGRADTIPFPATPPLLKEDVPAQAERSVAAGVANHRPAHWLIRLTERQSLLGRLGRIVPGDFHLEMARFGVDLQTLHVNAHGSLQCLHPRPRLDPVSQAVPLKNPLHRRRVRPAPEIAEAGQDPPRLVAARHLHQVFTQLSQGVGRVQHQPPTVQIKPPLPQIHQLRQSQR